MARFISHEPCPNCSSRDNLAVYDDGSKWCFGCGFYVKPSNQAKINNFRNKSFNKHDVISLPFDFSYRVRADAIKWLNRYNVTQEEIEKYGFGWTEQQQALVMPVFDADKRMRFYQLRYFNGGKQRYKIVGNKNDYHLILDHHSSHTCLSGIDNTGSVVVVVEDYLSAIRVSRQFPCVPLFGKDVQAVLSSIAGRFKQLVIYLDPDMAKAALKQSWRFSALFEGGASVVVADRDPKELTDKEIFSMIQAKTLDKQQNFDYS